MSLSISCITFCLVALVCSFPSMSLPSHSGHLYDSRVLIIHPDFGLPPQNHVLACWSQFRSWLSLESHSWRRVGGRLIRADSHQSSDNSVKMSNELASTLTSIQEFMVGVSRRLDQIEIPHASQTTHALPPRASLGTPFHLAYHYETIPPPTVTVPPSMVPTIDDTRLAEQKARVERLELRMRQIRFQDGGLTWDDRDDILAASLPAKFCMPDIERYSGIGCPKIHLRLYSTVMRAHGIDDAQLVALFPMSLSGATQRWFALVEPSRLCTWDDLAHEFLTHWRPPDRGQTSLFLPLSVVGGQKWLRLVLLAISIRVISHFSHPQYQYQPVYVQEATTHPPPRPYAQRPARQFTPLGMTLTRAFKKLRDAGLIVPFVPRPLPHPIPPHFHSHEHCLYHQIQGHDTERCSALHHAIQDLIDSGLVNLVGPSVTTNPLPTHSTHAVPPPPIGMGTSLGSSSVQNTSHSDYGHHRSHFHFVESSFQFIRVFMLRVRSFVVLFFVSHMMYSLVHLVI
ncbi:hypothetical protein AAG906_015614 [Vitis piasezkii]